jgi:hypothetical protein
MLSFRKRRLRMLLYIVGLGLLASALCFESPWFGFAFLSLSATTLFLVPVSVAHARLAAADVS